MQLGTLLRQKASPFTETSQSRIENMIVVIFGLKVRRHLNGAKEVKTSNGQDPLDWPPQIKMVTSCDPAAVQ